MIKINIIAAIGPNRELGKDNKLLWHISEDLKRFKKLTQEHAVIMGRKTFESLGKPLSDRLNIILTRHYVFSPASPPKGGSPLGFHPQRVNPKRLVQKQVSSLEEAISFVKDLRSTIYDQISRDEVFIIGGGQIYTQALPLADKLYLTLVEKTPEHSDGKFEADTFFPDYSKIFTKKVFEDKHEESGYKYTFIELIQQK